MKKLILIFIIIITISNITKSQDKIITTQGDTINCRIIKFDTEGIVYYRMQNDKWSKFLLKTELIKEYEKKSPEEWSDKEFNKPEPFRLPHKPFKVSINAGSAILSIANSKRTLKGFNCDANFNIFLNSKFGLGVKYNYYVTNFKLKLLDDPSFWSPQNPPVVYNGQDEKTTFNYVGFNVILRYPIMKKFFGNVALSAGANFFWNQEYLSNYVIKSADFAVNADVSFEYFIFDVFSTSAHFSVFFTELYHVKVNIIKIVHTDFTLGMNFYF